MFLQLASHCLTAERRVDRQPCSTSRFPTCGAHMCPANLRLPLPTDPWLVRPTHPWFRGQLCATERPGITRPRTSLQGSHGHRGGCRHGACSRRPAASPHSGAAPLQHCVRAPPHGGAAALQHCGGDRRGIKQAAAAPPHSLGDRHRPITVLRHPPPPPTTLLAGVPTRDGAGGDKDEAPRGTGPQDGGASAVQDDGASAVQDGGVTAARDASGVAAGAGGRAAAGGAPQAGTEETNGANVAPGKDVKFGAQPRAADGVKAMRGAAD